MERKAKRNLLIVIGISIVVMLYLLQKDYENIIGLFTQINVIWLIITILLSLIYYYLDIFFIRYYLMKHTPYYSLWQAIKAQSVNIFFGAITPFASGGQFTQIIYLRKQKISSSISASMLMVSFISWQTILVLFGIIALILKYNQFLSAYDQVFRLVLIGFFVNVSIIIGSYILACSSHNHKFIYNRVIPWLGKLRLIKSVEEKKVKVRQWLELFAQEVVYIMNNKKTLLFRVIIDVSKIIFFYSIPFFAAKSLGLDIDGDEFVLMFLLTGFIFMVTAFIPSPGAAGGSEAIFLLFLGPVLEASYITSTMLVWRFSTFYFPLLTSFLLFFNSKESKGEH